MNINTEMNYWLTEPTNLSECGGPLFDALTDLGQTGRSVARKHYNVPGWVLHHNFDLWRGAAPINAANHGIWPTGGAWLCLHLWWHYLYTGDKTFTGRAGHPLMKGASEFFVAYLVEDPRNDRHWLISGPSGSPEIGGLVMGPTMDHQIIRDLFANTAQAAACWASMRNLQANSTRCETGSRRTRSAARPAPGVARRQDDPKNDHRARLAPVGPVPRRGDHAGDAGAVPGRQTIAPLPRRRRHRLSRAWKINFWARLLDATTPT